MGLCRGEHLPAQRLGPFLGVLALVSSCLFQAGAPSSVSVVKNDDRTQGLLTGSERWVRLKLRRVFPGNVLSFYLVLSTDFDIPGKINF